ncbi:MULTISPECIES: fimbrial protein [unclassified Burkholderia]|uniref:fimbrial protein n=1 Tax=unclassified Burkholderia TaxID=2613784 RepID=UPI00141EF442|nr:MULTISPECIES: fimbrial protein [unclassified Burkholderia]NIE86310.1 fimbrial protein [Burkholderia sp. Tr-860]NIF67233.1 fimbrial protein [Burkholderia sp. Cy-647]NIF99057.1 fimbrial protein [Burkholderia sp. Ax-1720]
MNARTQSLAEPAVTDHFICASTRVEHVRWLAQTLVSTGAVESSPLEAVALTQRIGGLNPALVFIDFAGDQAAASTAVAAVRTAYPGLPVVALGTLVEPESALSALRAGVRDFVDLSAPAEEALRITRGLLDNLGEPTSRHGKVLSLLGARPGMGVSTLAANLAVLLQRKAAAQSRRTALIDLGLPAGDGALFLNTRCELHFVEAVRNLRRFDRTFVNTAFAHHASGVALTTLPPNLADLREVSAAACTGLFNRLRAFVDQQVVDLGGFTNRDFISQIVSLSDEVWLVCDQGVASVVSAVELLGDLREKGINLERVKLVVNQYDAAIGLLPAQIAERLDVPLLSTLPSRRVSIGHAANQGRLIVEAAERDPYVKALDALSERLTAGVPSLPGALPPAQAPAGGLSALKRFIHSTTKRS